MHPLALLLLVFGSLTQFPTPTASLVEVASTSAGPLTVWLEDSGAVQANGQLVTSGAERIGVASHGDYALVVWTQADGSVMAARRRPDGTAAGVVRRIGSNASGPLAVVDADDRYFVAWMGSLGEVYGAIVSTIGLPIVPAMPITTQSSSHIDEIAVAASAEGFAVVWHDLLARQVFATTVRASGVPVSMTPLLVTDDGGFPDVASDGEGFFVVWGIGTVSARTLSLEGELGRVRTVTVGTAPRVAWDGFAYSIAFLREVRPRPATVLQALMMLRISEYGTYVELLQPASIIFPRAWDVDARGGRLDLVFSGSAGVSVHSATVGEPRTRVRAVRY